MNEREPVARYNRSVNLDPQMAERLQRVCEHLGVTVNSYLKLKIGEVVAKDEISLIPKQSADAAAGILERFFQQAIEHEAAPADGEQQLELEVEQPRPVRKPRAAKAK